MTEDERSADPVYPTYIDEGGYEVYEMDGKPWTGDDIRGLAESMALQVDAGNYQVTVNLVNMGSSTRDFILQVRSVE